MTPTTHIETVVCTYISTENEIISWGRMKLNIQIVLGSLNDNDVSIIFVMTSNLNLLVNYLRDSRMFCFKYRFP